MEPARTQSSEGLCGVPNIDSKAVEPKQPQGIIPPFWQHQRAQSYASVISNGKPPPITLEDHTEESYDQSSPLWAKVVSIQDHVVVSGNVAGVGDYVVWICKVDTLDGGAMTIRKRYSEFEDLRERLISTFPNSKGSMPPLPPKSIFYRFRPDFLEKRRAGLAYFLNCVLLNPEFSSSPITKDFIFN